MFTLDELQRKKDAFCEFIESQKATFLKEQKEKLATQITEIMLREINEIRDCCFSPKLLVELKENKELFGMYIMDNVLNRDEKYICHFGIMIEKVGEIKIGDIHFEDKKTFNAFLELANFKSEADSDRKVYLIPPKDIIDILQWWEKNKTLT